MAPTAAVAALPEQQAFTFTNPVSSETHKDALDFDYESWIQQSKMTNTNSYPKMWLDDAADAQAISRHHREMMRQAMDCMPEEEYELSLRDLGELPLSSRATATDQSALHSSSRSSTARSPSNAKPLRKKTPAMEGAGFFIKLFMPSSSKGAGDGRKKRSSSPVSARSSASVNDSSWENAASGARIDRGCVRSHSMPRKSHHTTSRYLQTLISSMPGLGRSHQQIGFVIIPLFFIFLRQ